jgi:hypothetical protein
MAHIFNGPYDKLTDIDTADISNGDTARIRLGGYDRLMVFDSTATNATDTANLPVYIRPHDYAAAGVWVESVGHYSNLSINASQLATSIIKSLNVTTTTGAQWDLDNELFKMGGTNVNFALSSTPGIIFGLDSGAYKLSIGDATGAASAQSFIKWDGSLSIRMASGETFDLYGGLIIKDGADIKLEQGGVVYSTSTDSGSPGFVLTDDIDSPTWTNKMYQIASGQFYIDSDAATLNIRNYEDINNYSSLVLSRTTYESFSLVASNAGNAVSISGTTQSSYECVTISEGNSGASIIVGRTVVGNGVFLDPGNGTIKISPLSTEDLDIVDAGSSAATEQDWIEVKVGGNTGYIRVFAAK